MKIFLSIIIFIFCFDLAYANGDEQRLMNLYDVIKCPTCHGQSIKDSNADSAKLIKKNVIRMVSEGKTDEEIYAKIRSIYGPGSVTIPQTSAHNFILWTFPCIALLLLSFFFYRKNLD